MARKSVLGMATIFRLIEFVDQVFQVIEFIGRDFLKFDAKRLLVDPLHRRLRNRQRFLQSRNHETDHDRLPWEDLDITRKSRSAEREVERVSFDFMRIPQQQSLNLNRNTPVFSSFHLRHLSKMVGRRIPRSWTEMHPSLCLHQGRWPFRTGLLHLTYGSVISHDGAGSRGSTSQNYPVDAGEPHRASRCPHSCGATNL